MGSDEPAIGGKSDWDADVYAVGAEQKKVLKAVGAWMADSQPKYVCFLFVFLYYYYFIMLNTHVI